MYVSPEVGPSVRREKLPPRKPCIPPKFGEGGSNSSINWEGIEPIGSNPLEGDRFLLPDHATNMGQVYLTLPEGTAAGTQVTLRFRLSEDGGRLLITAQLPPDGGSVELEILV